MTWLDALTEKALARELPTRAEALNVLQSTEDELMDVVAAAFKVRLRYFGRRVKLNYLVNIKSGLCPEDWLAAGREHHVACLRRVLELDADLVVPAHGEPFAVAELAALLHSPPSAA